jgi:hypothetical protein
MTERFRGSWLLILAVVGAATMFACKTAVAQVPAPADILGFEPGTDYRLATSEQIFSYFRSLGEASDRVVVEEIGRSTMGRPLLAAIISSEANIRDRDHYSAISRRLAQGRGVSAEEAKQLADRGKAVVFIKSGNHGHEVAHGQHSPVLAHWLATDESAAARRIRENVILVHIPVMNPDGLDKVADWYSQQLGTPWETMRRPGRASYYSWNTNRDWFAYELSESRAVANLVYHHWLPQIYVDHHQKGPFPGRIWVPPFGGPVNPRIDPIVIASIGHIGQYIKAFFASEQKPGVTSGEWYRASWAGSISNPASMFRNMIGVLTETALHEYGTPECYDVADFASVFPLEFGVQPVPTTAPSVRYPDPWMGGCWHLADAIDYVFTASRAILTSAAQMKEQYLLNAHTMATRQIAKGEKLEDGVYAFVVDVDAQHDASAALDMLRALRQGGLEVRRADRSFRAGGREYPAGSYVIPPQAFWPFALDHLDPIVEFPGDRWYPGGPRRTSHDMTGYAMSLQMGVQVDKIAERFSIPSTVVQEIEIRPSSGSVNGRGDFGFAFSPANNRAVTATNRLISAGATLSTAAASFDAGGRSWPVGTKVVHGTERRDLERLATELGVEFISLDASPAVQLHELRKPKVGVYRSFMAPETGGWTRMLLDKYEIVYDDLHNEQVSSDLSRYDVVILPGQSPRDIRNGYSSGAMPPALTGGIGTDGTRQLQRYVENGGWLVAFGQAVDFAIATFDLPIRNLLQVRRAGGPLRGHDGYQPLGDEAFFSNNALVRLDVDTDHVLAAGMAQSAVGMFGRADQAYLVANADSRASDVQVYARYAAGSVLASGWLEGGDQYLAGGPAAMTVRVGEGRVVLIGFDTHVRGVPRSTFKLLFNPIYASTIDGGLASLLAKEGEASTGPRER